MPISNFNYYNPTRIIFGKDTIVELDKYLPLDKYYIICYGGGSIKNNGIYNKVIKSLGNRKYEEFGGIEANPDYETLMKCVLRCKEIGVDKIYILAVGGGSIVDGCKFICSAAYYEGDTWEMVLSWGINIKKTLPLAVVLTLPATGSESNMGAVISYRKIKRKETIMTELLFPVVSILDPDTMLSLPIRQIQNGVVDAFVHVCEQYVTDMQDADPQDRYSEGLLVTLYKYGSTIMKNQGDYNARANIMWCANQALNTLIQKGVKQDWATHMIGVELTANLGLDHGQTLAIVQPRLYEMKVDDKKDKLALLGKVVFGINDGSLIERAKKTIVLIEDFYRNIMKMKTKISELDCSQDKSWIDPLIERLKNENRRYGENSDITYKEVKIIIERCY